MLNQLKLVVRSNQDHASHTQTNIEARDAAAQIDIAICVINRHDSAAN